MFNQYKYKFYLDTNHAIYINDTLGQLHPHTWEFVLHVKDFNNSFTQFSDIEDIVRPTLDLYQNKIMNDIEPFNKINPTIENVCKYFHDVLKEKLQQKNIKLDSIELCESPKCSFIINDSDEQYAKRFQQTLGIPVKNAQNTTNNKSKISNENEKIVSSIMEEILKNKKKDGAQ